MAANETLRLGGELVEDTRLAVAGLAIEASTRPDLAYFSEADSMGGPVRLEAVVSGSQTQGTNSKPTTSTASGGGGNTPRKP